MFRGRGKPARGRGKATVGQSSDPDHMSSSFPPSSNGTPSTQTSKARSNIRRGKVTLAFSSFRLPDIQYLPLCVYQYFLHQPKQHIQQQQSPQQQLQQPTRRRHSEREAGEGQSAAGEGTAKSQPKQAPSSAQKAPKAQRGT